LETCVKNCGNAFHLHIATKDFLNDLVKVLSHKYNPAVHVQEKVLQLIQTWALAFRKNPELKEVEKVYEELKQKGVEFPSIDPDMPLLITSKQASVANPPRLSHSQSGNHHHAYPNQGGYNHQLQNRGDSTLIHQPSPAPAPVVSLSPMQKLRQDLGVVIGNVRVLNDMMSSLRPETIPPDDLQLLVELNRTCRAMQSRLLQLLQHSSHLLTDDTIMSELLQVNDDLNNAFLRYDRFEKRRQAFIMDNNHRSIPRSNSPPLMPPQSQPTTEHYAFGVSF
jgi:hypothetical protein